MITNAVAVINGKGGTGKTSVVANVAGLAAAADYKVLAIDLDPQANLGRDLGYSSEGSADGAVPLMAALANRAALEPRHDIRPGLDVVAGGEDLEDWAAIAASWRARGRSPELALDNALRPLTAEYDFVLLDCPPGNRELQLLAMHAAHYVVVPTRADEASLDGMVRVAALFDLVRARNPQLELLGVLLFGIESRASRIRTEVRNQIARDLGAADLVFSAEIRHLLAPARDARARGQLVHEYEQDVLSAPRFYEPGGQLERLASSAPGLAGDYQAVTLELLSRMNAIETAPVPA